MRALVAAIPIAHTLERRVVVAERTQGEASRQFAPGALGEFKFVEFY